jgi:hypothetical protein
MAVTSVTKTTKTKKPAVKKAAAKNGKNGNGAAVKDHEVITLRIDKAHKATLLDHCAKRAKQEGKQMSFNRAIIEWIESLAR